MRIQNDTAKNYVENEMIKIMSIAIPASIIQIMKFEMYYLKSARDI